jgi:phenylpropionate dioxygenase-like ring-hydroxylating dioxygenase large terminal subunit
MEATVGFDRGDFGLTPVRHAEWAGFIFYNIDGRAPPLMEWLGELPERLAMYGIGDMVATRQVVHEVACNWKTWVENYMEGYHIPTVHRATISNKKAVNTPEDPAGAGQYRAIFERHAGTLALLGGDAGFPPIESLAGESSEGSRFMLVYPATMLALCIDTMWVFHVLPVSAEVTRVVHLSLFPKSRLERPDFDALAANYYKRQDRVVAEDNGIASLQQKGLRSPLIRPGRFAAKEKIVHALDNWVLDRVLGAGARRD